MKFKKNAVSLAVSCVLTGIAAFMLVSPTPSSAANNPLSMVTSVETVNGLRVQYFDLTLNVDWDYDNANDPKRIQLGTGSNRGGGRPERVLDRQYIEDLVKQTARTLFVMTNGQHRLRNVYVFKNSKFGDNVDIRVLNVPGRANASAPGWLSAGGLTTNNYITNCNAPNQPDGQCEGDDAEVLDPESFVQTGEVIAHELGHYLYALFDEYQDSKDCDPANPSSPCKDDVARPSAMNNQAAAYRLSTAADYNNDFGKTAHGRAYGQSAWETLITSPDKDSAVARESHGNRRVQFDAFKGLTVPTIPSLKNFVDPNNNWNDRLARQTGNGAEVNTFAGFDDRLKVIFEGAPQGAPPAPARPRNVLIIDRTVPEATFKEIIAAAKGLIDRAPADSRFALNAFPAPGGTVAFTTSMDQAAKATLKEQLDKLTRTDATFSLQTVFDTSRALVTAARPKQGEAAENAANTDTFTLLTLNSTSVPEGLGTSARSDKISFNVLGFRAPVVVTSTPVIPPAVPPANSLQTLAVASGGSNNTVKDAKEAIKEGNNALQAAMGETEAVITADISDDPFKANTTLETKFRVNPKIDGPVTVRWYFDKADEAKLTFNCGANAVVTAALSDEESEASCTVTAAGEQTVSVRTAQDAGVVEVEVVSKPQGTAVELGTWIDGGTVASGRAPVLMAKLAGSTPIINATIKVQIFDADSESDKPVLEATLNKDNDAGKNGDTRANDGVYTLELTGKLPAGSYVVVAEASTDADSKFNPNGVINAQGISAAASAIGEPIQRLAEGEFDLETGAPGLKDSAGTTTTAATTTAAASSSKKFGGCTAGGGSDSGLLALLFLASIGLLRRRFMTPRRRAD